MIISLTVIWCQFVLLFITTAVSIIMNGWFYSNCLPSSLGYLYFKNYIEYSMFLFSDCALLVLKMNSNVDQIDLLGSNGKSETNSI